jgi:hypothetical protein
VFFWFVRSGELHSIEGLMGLKFCSILGKRAFFFYFTNLFIVSVFSSCYDVPFVF